MNQRIRDAKEMRESARLLMFLAAALYFFCIANVIPRQYSDALFIIWGVTVIADIVCRIRLRRLEKARHRRKRHRSRYTY